MPKPEIALIISSYQQARHLQWVLASVAGQVGLEPGALEVVVTDDGSTDETSRMVEAFAHSVDFPVRFITHPHQGFGLARSRNDGVRASSAPYLLFLDGDCLIPPDHLACHLKHRKPGAVMAGYCCRLDRTTTERIDEQAIFRGDYLQWVPPSELRLLAKMDRKARFYNWIRHPRKPKMFGGNIGIWRADFERVNGFDENFQAWGGEDDDLRLRLRRAGVRIHSILRWTRTYHLWHPPHQTTPQKIRHGANVGYLGRAARLTRCANGLEKRRPEDLVVRFVGQFPQAKTALCRMPPALRNACRDGISGRQSAEVEVLVLPGRGRFSGRADCNLLVVAGGSAVAGSLARQAHLVVSGQGPAGHGFGFHQWEEVLERILHGDTRKDPIEQAREWAA